MHWTCYFRSVIDFLKKIYSWPYFVRKNEIKPERNFNPQLSNHNQLHCLEATSLTSSLNELSLKNLLFFPTAWDSVATGINCCFAVEILSGIFNPSTYSFSAFDYFKDYSDTQPLLILDKNPPRRFLQEPTAIRE